MFYTTHEVAELLPNYNSSRTLLEALHNNQKKAVGLKKGIVDEFFLTKIWNCRQRVGKRWLFKKDDIDQILKGK